MKRMAAMSVAAVLLLSGCGDDGETATGASTTAPSGAAQTPTSGPGGLPPGHGHEGAIADCSPASTPPAVVALNTTFDKTCLAVRANQPFTISFENKDTVAHGFTIAQSDTAASSFFQQAPVPGPQTLTLSVGPLQPGTFTFKCQVHPNQMKGTFVAT